MQGGPPLGRGGPPMQGGPPSMQRPPSIAMQRPPGMGMPAQDLASQEQQLVQQIMAFSEEQIRQLPPSQQQQ